MATLAQRMAGVELLVVDIDGVLTDGQIIYAGQELELKAFHVRDGSGIKAWHDAGKRTAVITGRASAAVARRAAELGVAHVVQGAADKLAAFRAILEKASLAPAQAAAMGDDLPDLPVLQNAGLAIAVADACATVRRAAHYVTLAPGGRGAVREAIEWILGCQGT
jgi:3-deoxy-D-manno-octulosonate 8-phosphate phosphatase (KDO 8-P phosphatase)